MKIFGPNTHGGDGKTSLVCLEGTHELKPDVAADLKMLWDNAKTKVVDEMGLRGEGKNDLEILHLILFYYLGDD